MEDVVKAFINIEHEVLASMEILFGQSGETVAVASRQFTVKGQNLGSDQFNLLLELDQVDDLCQTICVFASCLGLMRCFLLK